MKFNDSSSLWGKSLFFSLAFIVIIVWPIIDHYENLVDECENSRSIYLPHPDTIKLESLRRLDFIPEEVLARGAAEMKKHKLLIVGIIRDNAYDLQMMIMTIENIGKYFKDYRVILFENDSEDGTKKLLHNWWLKNKKVRVISKRYNNLKAPNHKFLAESRNHYINAMKNKEYDDFDMVMAIDLDMSYGIDVRGIQDSFSEFDRWDVVCSNGFFTPEGRMYDGFSFRNDEFPWSPTKWQNICSVDIKSNEDSKWTDICKKGSSIKKESDYSVTYSHKLIAKNKLYWLLIFPQIQKIYPVSSDLVPVQSCFGGMAFYKRSFIEDCRYSSVDDDSEHVAFNECIRTKNNGRIFMNPTQAYRFSNFTSN